MGQNGNIQSIVASHLKVWTANASLRQGNQWTGQAWPLVTISREFGSQGALVGEKVANALGFSFWDHQLVEAIAKETGAGEILLDTLDEHARNRVEEFVAGLLMGRTGTAEEFVHQIAKTIRTIYKHGRAVVVGRGGQFVLFDEQALRVRIVADFDKRVKGYAERNELTISEAEKIVKKTDLEREKFIQMQYHRDVNKASNYDVVLNVTTLGMEDAAELIVAAYSTKFKIGRSKIEEHLKYAPQAI